MLGQYDRSIEEKWQKYWQEQQVYKFYPDSKKKKVYSIDTPPPFTSGELHMGHVLSYSYFDFVARYKRMNGFNVYYPQGWDCQGFPTEVRVEKKYGRLPPDQFRQRCIEWTADSIAKMKQQMIEIGFSPDWDYEYRTMDSDYHKKIQLSLIEMYNKKLIYRGEYPVYFCTNCSSAIAKAELDEVERTTILNYVKFKRKKTGGDIIIATTRPELFHVVNGLIVNPEDNKNTPLIGEIAIVPITNQEVPIVADKDADMTFGSGMAMVSSYGDKADVIWTFRHKLQSKRAVNDHGKIIDSGKYDGLSVSDARKKVIELLKEQNLLLKQENAQQIVKVHDRCGSPVELLNSKQWFADIKTTAPKIKELAHKVKWVPEFGITYLIDWVENAEWDWVISRQRVFGTPLPFYYCDSCSHTEPADINSLPFYAEKSKEKKCKCSGTLKPETSTCDCWVDSSLSPLIIAGWPDPKYKKLYPSSLRPQGVEIVRTWAFYTIFRSGVGLTGQAPWETILLNGNVLAPDGKKMSKSLGNIISPSELRKEYSTDSIRQWAALSGAMAKDRPFSYEDIKYAKSFINKFWNAAKFIEQAIQDYESKRSTSFPLFITDDWMFNRTNQIVQEFTAHMEKFEFHHAMSKFQQFFWHEVCDNYLEYVKHRIYQPKSPHEKESAQFTLYYLLYNSIKLLAPIAPHVCEEIYHSIFNDPEKMKSVHLSEWPKPLSVQEKSLSRMELFHQIISEIRQYKAKNKLAQNAELNKIEITMPDPKSFDKQLYEEIKSITKSKDLLLKTGGFKISFE